MRLTDLVVIAGHVDPVRLRNVRPGAGDVVEVAGRCVAAAQDRVTGTGDGVFVTERRIKTASGRIAVAKKVVIVTIRGDIGTKCIYVPVFQRGVITNDIGVNVIHDIGLPEQVHI